VQQYHRRQLQRGRAPGSNPAYRRQRELEMEQLLEIALEQLGEQAYEGSGEGLYEAQPKVRHLLCSAADQQKIEVVLGRKTTGNEVRKAAENAAKVAVSIARQAAAALEKHPRTARTRRLFCEAFGSTPDLVPSWRSSLTGTVLWKDAAELVAIRLRAAAKILDGGFIRYFCWGNPGHCAECSDVDAKYFACSSFKGKYVICLGRAFWRAFRKKDRATLASTLVHEALHIYFSTTVAHTGRIPNANCYERFAIRHAGLFLHPATKRDCAAGKC
jgi:hypothetical protein